MTETKKYKVNIFGDFFSIVSDEPESHIIESSKLVDSIMKEISKKTQICDTKRIAMLAALQLSSKCFILESGIKKEENIKRDLIRLIDTVNC